MLIASVFMLPYAAMLLRFKGAKAALKALVPPEAFPPSSLRDEQLREARQISRMVDAAANHGFYRANCLKRVLVLGWFMRRRGIPFKIRIGTRKGTERDGGESRFSAHAWVESGGVVVNDHYDIGDSFTPFDEHLNDRSEAI